MSRVGRTSALLLAIVASGCGGSPAATSSAEDWDYVNLTVTKVDLPQGGDPAFFWLKIYGPGWKSSALQEQSGQTIEGYTTRLFFLGESRHRCQGTCAHIGGYTLDLDVPIRGVKVECVCRRSKDGRVDVQVEIQAMQAGVAIKRTTLGRILQIGETWTIHNPSIAH